MINVIAFATLLAPAKTKMAAHRLQPGRLRWWLIACAVNLAMLLIALTASACPPAAGGDPNKQGQCAGAGNPINVMTGNKYQREDDMPALPGTLGLEIVRHYNSAFSRPGERNGVLGRGWRLSYETEIVDRWGTIQVLQADGGRVIFDRDRKAPTRCSTPDPANGTMTIGRQQDGQPDYTWTWTDGRKLHFNAAGKLDRITAPTGEMVRLLYDSQNVLVRVIDPQGRSLNLVYYDRKMPNQFHGVQFIDTPVGRFEYEYGSSLPKGAGLFDQRQLLANLVRVRLPDDFDPDRKAHALSSRGTTRSSTSRIYHHEDPRRPWLMTGISIGTIGADGKPVTIRYSTYGYDDTGRAILSTHAGNVDKVTLDNHEAGKTVLTNSLGQKTVYRYTVIAGEYRLLEVRGAGCALCGEPNVRSRYDDAGRLTESTKLSENGEPVVTIRTERDKLGRATRVSKIVYERGKPEPAQLQVRFEYRGNSFAPVLMARPSVVPGREVVKRIVYNDAGQPLTVSEAGWSPRTDGEQAPMPLERTVHYRYAEINGRSLLTEIDGPLPNGKTNNPLDSDITRIGYDHHKPGQPSPKSTPSGDRLVRYEPSERRDGIVTAIITPGNRKSEVEYDYAGRIANIKDAEGHTTHLRYSPRSQLLAITRDGITQTTVFDTLGNPVESGYDDGTHYHALARLGYDDAGRNIWIASALGIVRTSRYDTEDDLLEQSTHSSTIKQTRRYEYDDLGRLQAVTDPGGGTRRIDWNKLGLPGALTDALGRTTRFGYDAAANVTAVSQAPGATTHFDLDAYGRTTAIVEPNGATTRYVWDDFGRIVATIGADSGLTARRFDAADRLVASTDANGNRATYDYDVMGRIVAQRVTDAGNGGKTTVTTWKYEGPRLVAIDHPNQAERYNYDAQGRIVAKTAILTLAGGEHVSDTTRYRYDTLGQLAAISLPDGSTLDYRRNGQNQITALERSPAGSPSLRWLMPRQTIVRNLERDVVGLKRITYGNGIETYYQRSKEGTLARIVYRDPRMPASSLTGSSVLEALLSVRPALAAPAPALPGALGLPPDPKALLDHRYLWDVQGNLLYTRDKSAASSYAYDARDRLIAAATAATRSTAGAATGPSTRFARYYYDDNGNRLLAQEGLADQRDMHGNTVKTSYTPGADRWHAEVRGDGPSDASYDAAGQPEHIGKRSFVWDAFGKLLEVREDQRILARYRYNHRGERIEKIADGEHTYYLYDDRRLVAELDGKGMVRRQYVYLADQPVAVIDTPSGSMTDGSGDEASPIRLWHALFGKGDSIAYLQTNHLGAVEMVTDARGKPIWQAVYSPFGKLVPVSAPGKTAQAARHFELNLRLPGQYADKETGLYYNDHRYYDPAHGRYLTPDPLGLGGDSNGYEYVSSNPLKYIDPSGLILFAFDGTNNSNPPPGADDFSNVYKFFLAYDAIQNGPKWYMNGIGRDDPDSGIRTNWTDAVNANTGHIRVRFMQQRLDDYMSRTTFQKGETVNIDIVGFSRGAAMARDFANRVAGRLKADKYKKSGACVQIRFLGLWDTVAQFGVNGVANTEWNLAIPEEAKNVFQAVALNEHRYAFPGEAIGRGTQSGFIGSHADIGGSYGTGDLSDVALNWIVEQAKASGIKMFDWGKNGTNVQWGIVTNPVLHDKGGSDRDFCLRKNHETWADKCQKQKQATPGGMTWRQTQTGNLISLYPKPTLDADGSSKIVGKVNMKEYAAWLKKNYGLDVRFSSP